MDPLENPESQKGESPQAQDDQDRQTQPVDTEQPPRLPFPVVGIGASAGGLEAVTDFLSELRPGSGIAYVFIQHLPPTGDSMLVDILSKRSQIPVLHVEDGMALGPDKFYVIRPGHTLTIKDGRFHLGDRADTPARNHPVDDFFKSLAQEQRERAIAIVLSGAGSNGSAGAQAIKAVGGLCIAQDLATAVFSSMPRHLIDAGYADFLLPPQEMPRVLLDYAGHPYANGAREEKAALDHNDEKHLREILTTLRLRTRHDFNGYKRPTVLRRVQRRMGLNRVDRLGEYARLIRQTPAETLALADDLLIHVTGFFRDPQAWEALRERVIAPLIASRENGESIRCWATACSSGEEAYTLAILLMEEAARSQKILDVKVFATDLAERTLQNARNGLYPAAIESEISPERLDRFFLKEDALYRVRPELREQVVFASQNVLQDPPISRLDIITCRNLLIYLEPEMQHRILNLLHFGLRPGGTLFLGTSESVGVEDLFEVIDKRARIYRRIGPTRYVTADFPMRRVLGLDRPLNERDGGNPSGGPGTSMAQMVKRALSDQTARSGVATDREGKVVHYKGEEELPPAGTQEEPTRDLLQLALQTSTEELKATHEEVITTNEELQSTNEELETSREEMQSLNEELNTVNAQLRAEMEEHRAASNDLMSLLTSTDIAVLFLDPQLRIRRFTPSMRDLLDMIKTDVGRPLSNLARKFTDPNLEDDAHTVLERLLPIEREVAGANGHYYQRRALPYRTTDNRIDGVVITFVDITERKRIEEELAAAKERAAQADRLQRMMNIPVVGVLIVDRSGTVIDANDAFLRMTGYSREEVIRKTLNWRTMMPPELSKNSQEQLLGLAEVGHIEPYEREFLLKDGSRSWIMFAGASLGDGTVIEYCISVSDRKSAEEALQAAKAAAEEANRLKDDFLAVLSHELRTPLSAVLLWVQMLRENPALKENKQLLDGLNAVKSNTDAQKELIDDLWDVTRIASGQLRLQMRLIELRPLVRDAVDAIGPTAEAKGVKLHAELDSGNGLVRADAARLRQIVWNLLSNAVKFTPAGGTVECVLTDSEHQVEIRVSDSGRGISPEFLPHVFERFRQADSSTTRTEGGMGLGLTIVKQLTELHGGTVIAESKGVGRGATFIVRLPRAK